MFSTISQFFELRRTGYCLKSDGLRIQINEFIKFAILTGFYAKHELNIVANVLGIRHKIRTTKKVLKKSMCS